MKTMKGGDKNMDTEKVDDAALGIGAKEHRESKSKELSSGEPKNEPKDEPKNEPKDEPKNEPKDEDIIYAVLSAEEKAIFKEIHEEHAALNNVIKRTLEQATPRERRLLVRKKAVWKLITETHNLDKATLWKIDFNTGEVKMDLQKLTVDRVQN